MSITIDFNHTTGHNIDGGSATSTPYYVVMGGYGKTFWWEYRVVEQPNITGGTTTVTVVGDVTITTTTGATIKKDCILQAYQTRFEDTGAMPTITSSDPSVATIDGNGYVTHVTDGVSNFLFSSPVRTTTYTRTFLTEVEQSTQTITGYTDGTVRSNATGNIDTRIAVGGVTKPLFSTMDHTNKIYVRNTNCWAVAINLSCFSPWNSTGANTRAGALISPRHIMFAKHYPISNGATIRFVGTDNSLAERIMTNSMVAAEDLMIGILNSNVTNCSYAYVLPDNYASYISNDGLSMPIISTDQEKKALVTQISHISQFVSGTWYSFSAQQPSDPTRVHFYESPVGGDSGSPIFAIINNTPVILSVWTYGGYGNPGSGTSVVSYKSAINSAMATLGGPYQLHEMDLSSFTPV